MQNFRNYYDILGVARDSTIDDVKRAYRQLARRYHPDLNQGDKSAEERFKLLGEAYEVLSDPEKRSQYEQFSHFWKQKGFQIGKGFRGRGGEGRLSVDEADFGDFRDFNTFVDQLLNRRRENGVAANGRSAVRDRDPYRPGTTKKTYTVNPRPSRRDAEANLTIPLEKAYAGGQERIRLEDGRSLEVNMPAGMVTGQRIRLKGQGIGGGNLYLRIEVKPHAFFKIQGNDVFCCVPVTPSEAVLGGSIQVPTLDGQVKMTIPPGVQSGQRLRLANKGYPIGRERWGDQIVEIEVVVPTVPSDKEKQLYRELHRIETFNPRADLAM